MEQNLAKSPPATPTLKELTNALKSVSDWHLLGVILDLTCAELATIERNYRGDNTRCKTEMLSRWLQNTTCPSWEVVVQALRRMEANAVADTIRRKYVMSTATTEAHMENPLPVMTHKTMSGVTLNELLEEVGVSPTQLDKACTREHLRDIALFLDSWQTMAPHLGLSMVQVEKVERDETEENEKRLKFLESWKGKFAFKAKYIVLVETLLRIGRADQAEQVCRLLVQQPKKGTQNVGTNNGNAVPEAPRSAKEYQSPWKADVPSPHLLLPQSDVESWSKLLEGSQSSQQQPISQQWYQYQQSCEHSSRYSSHQPQFQGLSKPTERQLMEQLYHTVPDKWQPIGIYLEIPQAQLSAISERCRGDPQKCLMAVLTEKWLPRVNPPPTWQDLARAIDFIGRPDVAQTIRQLYCNC